MIWQLAREQLRSQRRYLIWTAALLTVTMALASFWAFSYATQIKADQAYAHVSGDDREWHGEVLVVSDPKNVSDVHYSADGTVSELNTALTSAFDNGSDVLARTDIDVVLDTPNTHTGDGYYYAPTVSALTGDVDWDAILAEGAAPQQGEVVISAEFASQRDVRIGDSVPLYAVLGEASADPVAQLTVSGLAYSPVRGTSFANWTVGNYVAWEDAASIAETANDIAYQSTVDGYGPGYYSPDASIFVSLDWNQGDPAVDALVYANGSTTQGTLSYERSSNATYYALVAGVAMLLGLVAMAFAVGRSQAQARMTWVATARTLGASRRTIAAATLAETLVVGLVASVVGITLGYLGTALTLAQARSTVVEPALPTTVNATWELVALLLAFGMLVAGIVGIIPAFWASRISPVAALKPVADVNEAQASRKVNPRYATLTWFVATIALALIRWIAADASLLKALEILLAIVVAVLTFVVLLEALRWAMPRIGSRLASSSRPWALAAGDSLVARPRQAAIPAFIIALGVAVLTTLTMSTWASGYLTLLAYGTGDPALTIWEDSPLQTLSVFVPITYVIVALITIAIWAAYHRSSAADAATREALGLTKVSNCIAAGVGYALPLLAGIVAGWCLGVFAFAWFVPGLTNLDVSDPLDLSERLGAVASSLWPVALVLLAGAATVAIGAVAVSLSTSRAATPIRQLQETH
ncbi:FtsX-like permease family protein [Demequina aurantiaca]|uniref:ABC transporter permease n=1 Tax=Demequina aurantiaca TaxID=676200 RepID=UPI003D337EA4